MTSPILIDLKQGRQENEYPTESEEVQLEIETARAVIEMERALWEALKKELAQ